MHTRLLFKYNGNGIRLCANVDWIYGTVSCWLWTNSKYVGICACLNLTVSLLGMMHYYDTIVIAYSPAIHQLQWHNTALRWCWLNVCNGIALAFNDQRVRWYWCKSKFEYFIILYTMHHDMIEYMERYRVGFGRTESTLVLVHVWIWMWHCLVYDAPWRYCNCTLACF